MLMKTETRSDEISFAKTVYRQEDGVVIVSPLGSNLPDLDSLTVKPSILTRDKKRIQQKYV